MIKKIAIFVFCVLSISCTREKKFVYRDLTNDGLFYTHVQRPGDRYEREIFSTKNKEVEIHVRAPEKVQPSEAPRRLMEMSLKLENLFKTYGVPYGGGISQVQSCAPEFHPLKATAENSTSLALFANSKYVLGICAQEQKYYQAVHSVIYCPTSQHLYEVKLFSREKSREDLLKIANNIHCN